jgi:hypothetical protein
MILQTVRPLQKPLFLKRLRVVSRANIAVEAASEPHCQQLWSERNSAESYLHNGKPNHHKAYNEEIGGNAL